MNAGCAARWNTPSGSALFSAGADRRFLPLLQLLGTDLLPEMDEGGFVLDYMMPAGSSLAETNRVVSHIEQICARFPKWRAPRGAPVCNWAGGGDGSQTGDILVKLKAKRHRDIDEIIADVRAKIDASRSRRSMSSSPRCCRT